MGSSGCSTDSPSPRLSKSIPVVKTHSVRTLPGSPGKRQFHRAATSCRWSTTCRNRDDRIRTCDLLIPRNPIPSTKFIFSRVLPLLAAKSYQRRTDNGSSTFPRQPRRSICQIRPCVTADEHLENALQHPSVLPRTGPQPELAAHEKTPVLQGFAAGCEVVQSGRVEDRGLEPLTFWLPARRSPN